MKKILLSLMAGILPMMATAFTGLVEIDGIWYNIETKSNTAEVSKKKTSNQYKGDIVIPNTVEYEGVTCNVTSIGKSAFYYCENLSSVTIPNSITNIGANAFQSSSLKSVFIPGGVKTISSSAFASCRQLEKVTLSEGLEEISAQSFSFCKSLTSITIPNSVKEVGGAAFWACERLDSVCIKDLKAWCQISFYYLNSTNLVFDHPYNLYLNGEEVVDLIIPEDCNVGNLAFHYCKSIKSVYFSNGISEIGKYAFYGCPNLTSVKIPEGVTYIGGYAFAGCSNLQTVSIPSTVSLIDSHQFEECPELTDVYCFATIAPLTSENPFYRVNPFNKSGIEHAVLHVPSASLDSYRTTYPWSEFGNIVALTEEETGIDSICKSEIKKLKYYTLDGKLVNSPRKGIYIMRASDGTSKKVLIK